MTIRIFTAVLTAALVCIPLAGAAQTAAAAPAAAAPAASASPQVADPKIEALAKSLLHGAQTDTLDRSMMTTQMAAQMTPALTKSVATQLTALGDYTSFTYAGSQTENGYTAYRFIVIFKPVTLSEFVTLQTDGKIAGLQFSK